MIFEKTPLEGLLIIKPKVFADDRGYFFESFHKERFEAAYGKPVNFVQDNESMSQKGVVRGLHFQAPPYAQGKLVKVIKGAVLDVAVDIRPNSPTYGESFVIELSEHNKTQLYIPEGFAHGFETLEDNTIFSYKCTNYYNPESEGSILWNDKQLAIKWQTNAPILSKKDQEGTAFNEFNSPF